MLINTLLRRLIIIRSDRKDRIDPGKIGFADRSHHFDRIVAAHSEHDRQASVILPNHATDDRLFLVSSQRRRFGRRSEHDQVIGPAGSHPFNQRFQCAEID